MTARGVEFRNEWTNENIPPLPAFVRCSRNHGEVLFRALANILRDDATTAGIGIIDLEIEGSQLERFIRETLIRGARK